MKPQDQALLTMLAAALVFGLAGYFFRRARGSSRSMSVFIAVFVVGSMLGLELLVSYDLISTRKSGMGLERLLVPLITWFVISVAGAFLGGLTYVFENRNPPVPFDQEPGDVQEILQAFGNSPTSGAGAHADWRLFAREAATGARRT